MNIKTSHLIFAAMLAVAPISSASAHDNWHHRERFGLFALGAAAIIGTVAVLTAPVRALAAPGYYNQPGYAPAYYAPQSYYAPAPAYYAAAPAYYAQPVYYYRR